MSGEELIKKLEKFGFKIVRIKGSHAVFKKTNF
ncbi:type II toxin-antitoxin system HicA family toxin [Thermodesulfovibrio hydrogeniphilus]